MEAGSIQTSPTRQPNDGHWMCRVTPTPSERAQPEADDSAPGPEPLAITSNPLYMTSVEEEHALPERVVAPSAEPEGTLLTLEHASGITRTCSLRQGKSLGR